MAMIPEMYGPKLVSPILNQNSFDNFTSGDKLVERLEEPACCARAHS